MRKFALLLGLLGWLSVASAAPPVCTIGAKGATPTATLSWTPPTTNTDGTPVKGPLTFNIYQSTTSGGEGTTPAVKGLIGSSASVTTGLQPGTTYYWTATAVDANGVESAQTNEVCKTFPASVPNTFTITLT